MEQVSAMANVVSGSRTAEQFGPSDAPIPQFSDRLRHTESSGVQ
jgi:hypothetical protein